MQRFPNPLNRPFFIRCSCASLLIIFGTGMTCAQDSVPAGLALDQSRQDSGERHKLSHDPETGFMLNELPFTSFHENSEATPYLYPLLAPGQVPVTRGFPMDPHPGEPNDHPHHKSVWVAHGDVDRIDFWTDKGKVELLECKIDTTRERGQLVVRTALMRDDKRFCDLDLIWTLAGNDSFRWIDAQVTFTAKESAVRLGDTKEGFFALRLNPDLQLVANSKLGVEKVFGNAFNSEGKTGGDVWGKQSKWVCYQGPVDGTEVSMVMMDHPENLRHPTTWHARDYGLVAANPFGLHDFLGRPMGEGEVLVQPESPLVLRYRILLASGLIEAPTIEVWFADFAKVRLLEQGENGNRVP